MKTKLPKSKAKTAYGLLSEIKRLILAEPLRLAMGVWLAREDDEYTDSDDVKCYPACGTVGCIGGWTQALTRKERTRASDILGLNDHQQTELFHDGRLVYAKNQQTARHARATAKHIVAFQKKYASQLKQKAV